MKIVGCDLHTRYQQVAMLDQETGELVERRLEHESGVGEGVIGVGGDGLLEQVDALLQSFGRDWSTPAGGRSGE